LKSTQVRNRIAHGQWKNAFTKNMMKINQGLMKNIGTENILNIQCRLAMFKSLAQIIHDLTVSKPTFLRDFDDNYKKIEEQKRNASEINYKRYKENMISKKQRGIKMRKNVIVHP